MNNTKILRAIGGIDDELIERAVPKSKTVTMKKMIWLRWAIPVAACFTIALIVMIPFIINNGVDDTGFDLSRSSGVKVNYIDNPPNIYSSASLVYLTEEELFAPKWMEVEIVAFAGEVTRVDNIVVSMGKSNTHTFYKAIAHIKVNEVFRGEISTGSTVTVLLPGPVGNPDIHVSDTGISSLMTVGTTGIFMPFAYNEESFMSTDGDSLCLLDLADYGLGDGVRWVFLQKGDEVVFARLDAYESISEATTMDEIRQYVISMLEN